MKNLLTLIIVCVTFNLFAQNPKREVVFKFKENETLFKTDFTFQTDNIHYYCLVNKNKPFIINEATVGKGEIVDLIVDGKIVESEIGVKPSTNWSYAKSSDKDIKINMLNNKFSYYTYKKEGDWFLKYNDKKYGPYEDVKVISNNLNYEEKIIAYKQMGQWFAILPDERFVGPYRDIDRVFYDQISKTHIIFDDSWTAYYNGRYLDNLNPTFIYRFISCSNGYTAFYYRDNKIYLNGYLIEKENLNSDYRLTNEGKFAYYYYVEGKTYLHINDQNFECPEELSGYDINNKGEFIYRFSKDNKDCVSLNGKVIGMHDEINYMDGMDGHIWLEDCTSFGGSAYYDAPFQSPMINDKGDYIYTHRTNGKFYVSINGRNEGPYTGTWKPYIDEKGNYMYPCRFEGNIYIVRNGDKGESLGDNVKLYMTRNGHYIFQFDKNGKKYVNVDGRVIEVSGGRYGNIISNVNENGQYFYAFSKDGIEYLCINGKNYKAPFFGGEWGIYEDIHEGYKAEYHVELGLGDKEYFNKICEKFSYNQIGEVIRVDTKNSIQTEKQKNLFSKDEKNIMQCGKDYPYVMINNQKYGNGNVIAVGYNQNLNVFRWAALEGKELVVYEYKLD